MSNLTPSSLSERLRAVTTVSDESTDVHDILRMFGDLLYDGTDAEVRLSSAARRGMACVLASCADRLANVLGEASVLEWEIQKSEESHGNGGKTDA